MKPVWVDEDGRTLLNDIAKAHLAKVNDSRFAGEHGVAEVDTERWLVAQRYERHTWLETLAGAERPRSEMEHARACDGYACLADIAVDTIAEVGCGPFSTLGHILEAMRTQPHRVVLIDPLILDYATMPACTYSKGTLYDLPVELVASTVEEHTVQPVDMLVAMNVLEHCRSFAGYKRGIERLMKRDGILVWAEHCYESVDPLVEYDAGHPLRVHIEPLTEWLIQHVPSPWLDRHTKTMHQPYRYVIGRWQP